MADSGGGLRSSMQDAHARLVAEAFRSHAALVERVLRRAGIAERDLYDVRQEVFIVVHRRLHEFEGRASLSTWLYRIAFNVASDHRRRAYHRRESLDELANEPSDGGDAAVAVEDRQLLEHALHALEQLDPDQREAFVLSELYELPMAEVAERVGCPRKTAFSRTYAARRKIVAALRARGALTMFWPGLRPLRLGERVWQQAATSVGGQGMAFAVALSLCAFLPAMSAPGASRQAAASAVVAPVARAAPMVAKAAAATAAETESSVGSSTPEARRVASVRPRSKQQPQVELPAAPATEVIPAAASSAEEDMQLVWAGAVELRPVVTAPLAPEPLPEPRASRIALRGPRDLADAVEAALLGERAPSGTAN